MSTPLTDSINNLINYINNITEQNDTTLNSAIHTLADGYGQGGVSATQHTIHLEFSDETTTDIKIYYDNALFNTIITAYDLVTYEQKTVTLAQLDNVTWYSYDPTETWETVYDDDRVNFMADSPYPYCWIADLADVTTPIGSTWRITFDGIEYRCIVIQIAYGNSDSGNGLIGNPKFDAGTDDGSNVPFAINHSSYGAWIGSADVSPDSFHSLKIERLIS